MARQWKPRVKPMINESAKPVHFLDHVIFGRGLPANGVKWGDMTREQVAASGRQCEELEQLPEAQTVREAWECAHGAQQ
jgi:hypothetical protein